MECLSLHCSLLAVFFFAKLWLTYPHFTGLTAKFQNNIERLSFQLAKLAGGQLQISR